MSTMKAIRIHRYGGHEVLLYEDAPRPVAGEGEVIIRMYATSVNPFDCAVHAGFVASYFHYTLPLIPGMDVSGVIDEVGAGVTRFKPGDAVYTRAGIFQDGAYAEYVRAKASDLARKPESLDHIQAAAIPHVTLAAWHALNHIADLKPGQSVLIHGAGGGVGHMAVQLAKLCDARVIGTASVNAGLAKSMGADEVIDYTTTPFEQVVHDVDVVLDTIGGDTQERSWRTLKPGGILISTAQPPSAETAKVYGVRQAMIDATPPMAQTLNEIARMVDNGLLRPVVSKVFELEEVQLAHQLIEGRHVGGKLVLRDGHAG